jgi:hypothetical protein
MQAGGMQQRCFHRTLLVFVCSPPFALFAATVGKSNVQIAKHIGVDEGTVRNWRDRLTSEIPKSPTRTGSDGRTIDTSNIGKRKPAESVCPSRRADIPQFESLCSIMAIDRVPLLVGRWFRAGSEFLLRAGPFSAKVYSSPPLERKLSRSARLHNGGPWPPGVAGRFNGRVDAALLIRKAPDRAHQLAACGELLTARRRDPIPTGHEFHKPHVCSVKT